MSAARREGLYLLTALQFLTRLPVPPLVHFESRWLDRGAKYFPAVGALVGLLSGLVFLAAAAVWQGNVAALMAVASSVAITGAFHEDGFADFFDAAGGTTREARLTIMKDSRVGTFGALALVFSVAARVAALAGLPPPVALAALVASHAGGRFIVLCVHTALSYSGDAAAAKVRPLSPLPPRDFAIAAVFGCAPVFLLPAATALTAAAAGALCAVLLAHRAQRLLGGCTGDVLGAAEQSFEMGFLLAVAACFRAIQ